MMFAAFDSHLVNAHDTVVNVNVEFVDVDSPVVDARSTVAAVYFMVANVAEKVRSIGWTA